MEGIVGFDCSEYFKDFEDAALPEFEDEAEGMLGSEVESSDLEQYAEGGILEVLLDAEKTKSRMPVTFRFSTTGNDSFDTMEFVYCGFYR